MPLLLLLAAAGAASAQETGWERALPGWRYEFPQDHFTHPGFKTEWWYVTGRVQTGAGRRFGYQFTIFRRGLRPPEEQALIRSRWVVNELPLGHFALTDEQGGRFYYNQKLLRGAFGEAGFAAAGGAEDRLAWIGDWALRRAEDGVMSVKASQPGAALDLKLEPPPGRPPVINGAGGVSQKSAGAGNASHYYSMTRLRTSGTVTVNGKTEAVTGLSWLDREWATNQLSAGQVGWDWLSLHLSDGSDLMLYQLRGRDGKADEFSSGTLVGADGASEHLTSRDFSLTPVPGKTWRSAKSGGTYPTVWQVAVPGKKLNLEVRALLPDQELALDPVSYWEGAVDAAGSREGRELKAEGYLEMTGYSGALRALRE
ncbi:MAG: lipocalin-like domain-containing protein [Verrucomicrobiota bacterium]